MHIEERKDGPDTRYCVRCGILESEVRKQGNDGCYLGYGAPMYKNHKYTTDREIEEYFEKEGK